MPERLLVFSGRFEVVILIGELLFCLAKPFRRHGLLRLLAGIFLAAVLPFFWNYYELLHLPDSFQIDFILRFLVCMGVIGVSFRLSFYEVLLYGTAAYAFQHIWYCLFFITAKIIGLSYNSMTIKWVGLALEVLILTTEYRACARPFFQNDSATSENASMIAFSLLSILILCVLHSWTQARLGDDPDQMDISIYIYALISSIMLLVCLFGTIQHQRLSDERNKMQSLLRESELKHRMTLENMEIIGRKCHDLRHQIAAIRNMRGDEREAYVSELEKAVMFYDRIYKTGCETLDILLNEKRLICEQHGVQLTVLANAKGLGFMDVIDLYTLFGNLLDNAIEASSLVEEADRRIICINIAPIGTGISILIENSMRIPTTFIDGIPQTIKQDKASHGYGTRSVRYLVEKYEGVLEMSQGNNKFSVSILFAGR